MKMLIDETRKFVAPEEIANTGSFRRVLRYVLDGVQLRTEDWSVIGREYIAFSASFPDILANLIDRLSNSNSSISDLKQAKDWLQEIYEEETATGSKAGAVPHNQMFANFLTAVGVIPGQDSSRSQQTDSLLHGLRELYKNESIYAALGAQTAFELIGEEIIRGFSQIAFRNANVDRQHLRYFDIHLVAEAVHIDKMCNVTTTVQSAEKEARESFLYGAAKAAKLLKSFWSQMWCPVLTADLSQTLLFLSWSGRSSQSVALNVRDRLVEGIPGLSQDEVFFSDTDISSGQFWADVLDHELSSASAGLIILSPESIRSAWVNFEAGILFQRQSATQNLHVLILGSRPSEYLGSHPLQRLQFAQQGNVNTFVKALVELVESQRPVDRSLNETDIRALADEIDSILSHAAFEADREMERRVERTRDWLSYLLSLTSRDLNCPARFPDAPTSLTNFDEVYRVVRLLVVRFMAPRIDSGMRVYLATRLSHAAQKQTYNKYVYRLLFSAAGTDSEGAWLQHSLVGKCSTIHKTFSTKLPQPDSDATTNADVEEEKAVHCRPIKLGNTVLCAVAISSNRYDPSGRLAEIACEFQYILEWFFSIVATRIRWGKILVKDDHIKGTSSDDEVGVVIEQELRLWDEFQSFDEDHRPKKELEVGSSIA